MASKLDGSLANAEEIAQRCEDAVSAERSDKATKRMAEHLLLAAKTTRGLHNALASLSVECMHTLTMRITDEQYKSGLEHRERGKYCMTCGIKMHEYAARRGVKSEA